MSPLRLSRPVCGGLILTVALLAGCSSTTAGPSYHRPHRSDGTASPAQQAAALDATTAFRSQMAVAGESLDSALSSLAEDLAAGRTAPALADLTSVQRAFDVARAEVVLGPGGLTTPTNDMGSSLTDGGIAQLRASLAAGQSDTTGAAQLATEGGDAELLMSRIVLTPQDVALEAQRALAWVAASAAQVLTAPAPDGLTRGDLVVTTDAVASTVEGLAPLGSMISPGPTALAGERVTALESALGGATSPAAVVGAADAALGALGELSGGLAGYGQGGQYQ